MQGFLKKNQPLPPPKKIGLLPVNEFLYLYSYKHTHPQCTVNCKRNNCEEDNIVYICFLLEGRSVGTGHPLTVECNPVVSHVPSRSFVKPTHLEVLHECTAFNTLRYELSIIFSNKQLQQVISKLPLPLFQNESLCRTFHTERSVICMKIEVQMKQIFVRMVCTMTRLDIEAKGNS